MHAVVAAGFGTVDQTSTSWFSVAVPREQWVPVECVRDLHCLDGDGHALVFDCRVTGRESDGKEKIQMMVNYCHKPPRTCAAGVLDDASKSDLGRS